MKFDLASLAMLASIGLGSAQAATPVQFDFKPEKAGLDGGKVSADGLQLSDYGQILINPLTGAFREQGYLPVLSFTAQNRSVSPDGFNNPAATGWGAYISYTGAGYQAFTPSGILATYTSLTYQLIGFNGLATYGLGPTGAAYVTGAQDATVLGQGSLISGSLLLIPTAFIGPQPVQFAVQGLIHATITDIPAKFSNTDLSAIDLTIVHLPGEVFPISATTFEANGGASSSAMFVTTGDLGKTATKNAIDPQSFGIPVPVDEPASAVLLVAGFLGLGLISKRARSFR